MNEQQDSDLEPMSGTKPMLASAPGQESIELDPQRFFNKEQKLALYWLADGMCENCGDELQQSWHGDHFPIPWSKGGRTDVSNGRALCPDCNWKFGNRSILSH